MAKNAEKNKVKFGLKAKFIAGMTLIVVCVVSTVIAVGAQSNWNSITTNYNNVAYQTARTAAGYFTEEELCQFADLVYKYNHGEISEDELEKVVNSQRYKDIWQLVDNLRISMNANDIYVNVFDMDILKNFDEAQYKAKNWTPIYYIVDSYYKAEEQFPMGAKGAIKKEYREDSIKAVESGKHIDKMIITKGDFGYILTASYPVVYNGKTVATVAVEIPMSTLKHDIQKYVIRVLVISLIIMAILLTLGILYIIRTLIRPIGIVVSETEKFVENNAEISEKLQKIKTRDEIQILSGSLLKMETDIKTYIENIKTVTAEKERIGAELDVATQIQANMLPCIFPAFPERKEFDIYASMCPAKEVGGDFYDFFLIDEDHLALVMADVSGKGIPAALFMVIAKTLIKNRTFMGGTPSEILYDVNNQLCEGNKASMFVTTWLCIIDISTGKCVASNAGHEYPAIHRNGGKFELYKQKHSPAVAVIEDIKFRQYEFDIRPGDCIFVYTDGVTEATDENYKLFGTDRMIEALNTDSGSSPDKLLESVHICISEFIDEAPQFDDITMLAFKYYGAEGR